MAELVSLEKIAKLLNFSEDEVMELVRKHEIPNIYFPRRDEYVFPREEVLARITPRPKRKEEEVVVDMGIKVDDTKPVAERRGRRKNKS